MDMATGTIFVALHFRFYNMMIKVQVMAHKNPQLLLSYLSKRGISAERYGNAK